VKYLHSFNRQEHVLSVSAASADGITNKANDSTPTIAITCACCHCFMIFHISATENSTFSTCKTPVYKLIIWACQYLKWIMKALFYKDYYAVATWELYKPMSDILDANAARFFLPESGCDPSHPNRQQWTWVSVQRLILEILLLLNLIRFCWCWLAILYILALVLGNSPRYDTALPFW